MKDVLFFSEKCKHSRDLLNSLRDAPFKGQFCYVNVDTKRDDDLLKILEVQYVPTMFVGGRMLIGEQVFSWFDAAFDEFASRSREPPARRVVHQEPARSQFVNDEVDTGRSDDVFNPQPVNGSDVGAAFSDFAPSSAAPSREDYSRLPDPVHVRRSDKLDDGNMTQMLRQLEEERSSGVPLSLQEQKSRMNAMQRLP
jgi:hypothetical protein